MQVPRHRMLRPVPDPRAPAVPSPAPVPAPVPAPAVPSAVT